MDLATEVSGIQAFAKSFNQNADCTSLLNSIVGVSNQLSWVAIGIASLRFRTAIRVQNKEHLLPFKNWTYPWGPWFCIILNSFLILVQGWSSFSPSFNVATFFSLYIELPIMLVMYMGWKLLKRTKIVKLSEMDLETDTHTAEELDRDSSIEKNKWRQKAYMAWRWLL